MLGLCRAAPVQQIVGCFCVLNPPPFGTGSAVTLKNFSPVTSDSVPTKRFESAVWMTSGRNKVTFVDVKRGSSKTTVKRPGLLSRNSLSCAAVGLPVRLIPRLQAQLGTAVAAGSDLLCQKFPYIVTILILYFFSP